MVDLDTYDFKDLNTVKITTKYFFDNAYTEELFELEHVRTYNKQLYVILDANYDNIYFHKIMKTECHYPTVTQLNKLLKL